MEISLYDLFNRLGWAFAILFNLCLYRRKSGLLSTHSRLRLQKNPHASAARYIIAETILLTLAQLCTGGLCNVSWAAYLNGGGGNYFGLAYFAPPFFLLICMLARVNPLKQLDLFTPSYAVSLICYKAACLLHGCCQGKPWIHGLYFVNRKRFEFPSQFLEMVVAVLILFLLVRMIRRKPVPGSVFPTYLILYSGTRFFTEFTRDGEVVLMGLQLYQIQCIAGVLLGIIELLLIRKYGQRWSDSFEQKQEQYIQSKNKDITTQS